MGNGGSRDAGKVVLPDGSVREFQEAVTAAELMMEHPGQVVVKLRHPHKPTPLPADKSLELGRIYLMLPLRRGRKIPSISSQDSHQILLSVTALLRPRSSFLASSGSLRFLKRVCPTSTGNGNGNRFMVLKREVEPEEEEDDEFSVGKNNCLSRQVSGKGWKPSLDTIKEKKEAGKDVNLVVLAAKVGRRVENKGLVWG